MWMVTACVFATCVSTACDDDKSDDSADSSVADTGTVTDTGETDAGDTALDTGTADTGPVDDTVADTTAADTTPAESCVANAGSCEGYLRVRCDANGMSTSVEEVCGVGCEAGACVNTCTAGADIGCVNGSARRCDNTGNAAFAVACLGGCDDAGIGCVPLGVQERVFYTATGALSGVRMAGVGGAPDGWMLFAWQITGADEVNVVLADADGNALSLPAALPRSTQTTFNQLQVRANGGGDFVVMGVSASAGGGAGNPTTIWTVPRGGSGAPTISGRLRVDGIAFHLPSVVALADGPVVFHLTNNTATSQVLASSFGADDAPTSEIVDAAAMARNDLVAVRVGAVAHVFQSTDDTVRFRVFAQETNTAATQTVDASARLFTNAASDGTRSVLGTFDFFTDPAAGDVVTFGGSSLSSFLPLGAPSWLQVAATSDRIVAVTQGFDGTLAYIGDVADTNKPPITVFPAGGTSVRDKFWLVYDPPNDRVRLVTLGKETASTAPELRISAP